jgi:hypothetical protein
MNSPDSRCQAVFRAHFFADGRSLLPHLCRSSGRGLHEKVAAVTLWTLPVAGAMLRWRNCSAQKN